MSTTVAECVSVCVHVCAYVCVCVCVYTPQSQWLREEAVCTLYTNTNEPLWPTVGYVPVGQHLLLFSIIVVFKRHYFIDINPFSACAIANSF